MARIFKKANTTKGFTLISLLRLRWRSCTGFSLIELMVAISIIAILAVIGVAIYGTVQEKSRDARRKSDIDAIANAYEQTYDPVKNKYKLLAQTDFQSGKFPSPPEKPKGYYDGFNSSQYFDTATAKGSSWMICARLEGQNSKCTQNSSNCYCRASTQGSKAESIASVGTFTTLTLGADGSAIPMSPIPTDGLVLWLRADDIKQSDPTQVSGGKVIKWVSSPYCCGKDAVKKGSYNTPDFVANAINGKPLVRFVGGWNGSYWSGQILEVANLTGSSYFSLFFVGSITNQYPLSWGNPPWASGTNKGGFYTYPSNISVYLNGAQSSTYGGTQNWTNNSINSVIKSSSFSCYQGLNSANCNTGGSIGQNSIIGNFIIGGMNWNTADSSIVNYFGGANFAEIIMYDRPLVGSAALDSERNEVINYLKSKYGL